MASAPKKFPRIVDAALETLNRCIAQSDKLNPDDIHYVWSMDQTDPAEDYEEFTEPKEREDQLQARLEATYDHRQRELARRIREIDEQPELHDNGADLKLVGELIDSYTPEQHAIFDQMDAAGDEIVDNYDRALARNAAFSVPVPPPLHESCDAIRYILQTASIINGEAMNEEKKPFFSFYRNENGDAIPVFFHRPGGDMRSLIPILDGHIRADLQNPEHWKRVRTTKGVGYVIEDSVESEKFPLASSVAHTLSEMFLPNERVRQHLVDGAPVTNLEFVQAMVRRESGESEQKCGSRLILFGNAAKTLLEDMLGVDMKKIKDAPRMGRG